jgi:23S rRNA (uracil1939-C5)-methyltransferase
VNEGLVARVVEIAKKEGARTFLDLYCGSGNFSFPLAAEGLSGVGVEENAEAIDAARHGAREAGVAVEFLAEPCERYIKRASRAGHHFDMVVLDPPRAGAKQILPALLSMKSPTILMVSCDPVTFARDLRLLVDGGYHLAQVEGWDMFPQTHHVESFAVLRRRESRLEAESPRHSPGAL